MARKVGIVIVNYRTAELTIDCVRSLARLDYPDVDIVVVDNASGDGSMATLRRQLPAAVTLVEATDNGGYTAGNNLGIAVARARGCDYIHLLNPDTILLEPGYLQALVARLEAHPGVGAVGPRVHWRKAGVIQNTVLEFPWLWRRVANAIRHRVMGKTMRSSDAVRQVEVLNGVCVLYRAQCLRQIGDFDERIFAYVDEADWAFRARRAGWTLEYLPVDSVVHLQKQAGYARTGTVDFLLKRNTVFFLLKNRKYIQAAGYTLSTAAAGLGLLTAAWRSAPGFSGVLAWYRGLLQTYWWLWTARWDRAMGKPKLAPVV